MKKSLQRCRNAVVIKYTRTFANNTWPPAIPGKIEVLCCFFILVYRTWSPVFQWNIFIKKELDKICNSDHPKSILNPDSEALLSFHPWYDEIRERLTTWNQKYERTNARTHAHTHARTPPRTHACTNAESETIFFKSSKIHPYWLRNRQQKRTLKSKVFFLSEHRRVTTFCGLTYNDQLVKPMG